MVEWNWVSKFMIQISLKVTGISNDWNISEKDLIKANETFKNEIVIEKYNDEKRKITNNDSKNDI